jgi:pimeloyl-ACP methyl ester carboxylesterase
MKTIFPLFILAALILVTGCSKESDKPENKVLVSYTQTNVFQLEAIVSLLSSLEPDYPGATSIKEHARYSVQVCRITYKTTYKNETITASGLVCLPAADESFPLISFQNGTNTAHADAPSVNPLNYNFLLLEAMASNGYILMIPDYIGFGASADKIHPYYEKESTARSVIDMMKAVQELVKASSIAANTNGTNYLMGYSQGGWATLSVLEALEGATSDLVVDAASCGAGAYDLMAMSDWVMGLETFPAPHYLPYFVYSEQDYGALSDPLTRFFNEPYASKIPELFNGNYENDQVNSQLNDTIAVLLTADMMANFATGQDFAPLRNALKKNSVTAWNPHALIRFYHGTADVNVPPEQTTLMASRMLDAGGDPDRVVVVPLEGLNHETGVIPWGIETINWFNELENK